ncbi:MAG TPA: M20/M25/M40 family metallo-hydrolase [Thermoanaerobaculia bacterium]|nr:M20/M25/M40 family metallo-hydrolase [Thermoanaerobaculia bacterium]
MKWIIAAILLLALAVTAFAVMRRRGATRTLAPLTPAQQSLRDALRRDVTALANLGERHVHAPENLHAAADYVERALGDRVERQSFETDGVRADNLILEIRGTSSEIVIVGAHYDTVDGTPGADDNASGVAAMLALARHFNEARPRRTLRFVAFTNEEPPHFKTEAMGSWRYAQRCHERKENIVAMLSLEMLGYYDAKRGAQRYPPPLAAFYPTTADFVAFAGNLKSRALVKQCTRAFRRANTMPSESAALPEAMQQIGWSDQWSFWQFGWPAIMVSDTALFRNPHYHLDSDTPETLDYDRMARAVDGLTQVVADLAR